VGECEWGEGGGAERLFVDSAPGVIGGSHAGMPSRGSKSKLGPRRCEPLPRRRVSSTPSWQRLHRRPTVSGVVLPSPLSLNIAAGVAGSAPSAVWAAAVSCSEPRARRRACHVRHSCRNCLQDSLASTQGENGVHPSTRGPNLGAPWSCRGTPHDAPPRHAPCACRASRIYELAFEPRWFCVGEEFHT
jgi:hypothetical protein